MFEEVTTPSRATWPTPLPSPCASKAAGKSIELDEYMAAIAAERVVRHLERAGFVVMRKRPIVGGAALGRGFEG